MLTKLRIMLSDFLAVIGHSWDLDQKRNGAKLVLISLMEFGKKLLIFRELRSKARGKKTIHFNGGEQNVELILRTVTSANQLCGAIANMCTEVSKDTMASGKPEEHDPLETMETPTEPPTADRRTDEQRRWNLLQEYEQQFEQLSDDQKLSKLCSEASVEISRKRTIFHHTWCRKTKRNGTLMHRIYAASSRSENSSERLDS